MIHNHKFIELKDRPRCSIPECTAPRQLLGTYRKDGNPNFRNVCQDHHYKKLTTDNGFSTVTNFINSMHPSRRYRDMHCYNIDDRLGHGKCTATITWEGQLTVDHIDGNPYNNEPKNLQTLCFNCHSLKTHLYKDYLTPGRKTQKTIPGSAKVFAASKKRNLRHNTLPL